SLPLTLALVHVLLVERGGQAFGVPLAQVEEATQVNGTLSLGGKASLDVRGVSLQLADLADLLGGTAPSPVDKPPAIVVAAWCRRTARRRTDARPRSSSSRTHSPFGSFSAASWRRPGTRSRPRVTGATHSSGSPPMRRFGSSSRISRCPRWTASS